MSRKGLNTAIAVVVTIVVLLIIAIAVVTMTTSNVSDLGSKAKGVIDVFKSNELKCSALNDQALCENSDGCSWDNTNKKCVPS